MMVAGHPPARAFSMVLKEERDRTSAHVCSEVASNQHDTGNHRKEPAAKPHSGFHWPGPGPLNLMEASPSPTAPHLPSPCRWLGRAPGQGPTGDRFLLCL
jgi:hypothetical protein